MFTIDWIDLGKIILIGILAYIGLIIMLRIAGKRTLTQLNAFDLVITVSIGSVLGTILLDKTISIFDGMTAFLVLITLQWAFTKTTTESEKMDEIIRGKATLLYFRGRYCVEEMKRERIEREEMKQVVRMEGISTMENVESVILESNGKFSVLTDYSKGKQSTFTK